jgi:mono/diheme cytochrome c family protein
MGWGRARLLAAAMAAAATTVGQAHDPVPKATWTRDVQPIISTHCGSCHSPGGAALPALAALEDLKTHRDAVKRSILDRRMPPWGAVRGFGAFKDDPSLSPQQIATVAAWIEAGMPPGPYWARPSRTESGVAPVAALGDPIRLTLPPFSGTGDVQDQVVQVSTRAIGAWQFLPGDATVQNVRFSDITGPVLWTWSAGSKGAFVLPKGTAFALSGKGLKLVITRRTQDGGGRYRPPKRQESVLLLWPVSGAMPLRWRRSECGATAALEGRLYAIRPMRIDAGAIEVVATHPSRVLGRFLETPGSVTYWLREPADIPNRGSVSVVGDACSVELLTTGRGRRSATPK